MKRALVAVTAVVAVLALSSCDAVESTNTAATVGSSEVTVDQLQHVIEALGSAQESIDVNTDTIDGQTARVYLTALIHDQVNREFLAAHGEQITDEDRQQALATLSIPPGLPDDVVRLVADSQAASTVQNRVPGPPADELAARYTESPIDLGLMCVRQIVLPTEAAGDDVIDELANGATFADLVDRSIDATTKANGGAVLGSGGGPCISPGDAVPALGSDVMQPVSEASAGEIVGPVRGDGGWHVVQVRPYDEVSDTVGELASQVGGQLLYIGFASDADVRVDPRYGRWDRALGAVVAL